MGTRADFYIGRGPDMKWIGSTAYDGYPCRGDSDAGMDAELLNAPTEKAFKEVFDKSIRTRDDFTRPDQGWPWPWEDSNTTDFAYAFEDGVVWASRFGGPWFKATGEEAEVGDAPVFPDMKAVQNVTLGRRSGVLIVGG